jgi:hypothetical protein
MAGGLILELHGGSTLAQPASTLMAENKQIMPMRVQ